MINKQDTPIPQGQYLPAKRFNNIIYTAGMTPRNKGKVILEGKITVDRPLDFYKPAVCQAVSNALVAAVNCLQDNEKIATIITMTVYVNAEEGFTAHSKLADFASAFLCEKLGEVGVASRVAIGVATLPGNAPVEIQLIAGISEK